MNKDDDKARVLECLKELQDSFEDSRGTVNGLNLWKYDRGWWREVEAFSFQALLELARKMKENDIPCSAYQMSYGYTVFEHPPKPRNVFTWNLHHFPHPMVFIEEYHKLGMRLVANIKHYVLENHPEYQKLKGAGALFADPHTNQSVITRLWSDERGENGLGSHIDFTSAKDIKRRREEGIDCM
ncbi:hypothetical protein N0V84_009792 [Fusarium piperis]|uniref:Glycoside hydrolase family 31 TIM barrel domain-containing protein n=1 Tax=Fusarium piperis TaxID=1435070 RepID=A0A9W8W5N8_9HYPO|nr:hypothetical protein N0V84_009792 [Fusarium piperis]